MSLLIELQDLPPEGIRIRGTVAAEGLDIDCQHGTTVGEVEYDLRLELIGDEFLARGRVTVAVEFVCSRCLKSFRRKISISDFSYSRDISGYEIIDLTEGVREDIIIALPIKPLCDSGCKGICPRCGKDLNAGPCGCDRQGEDSRWGALDGLELTPEE